MTEVTEFSRLNFAYPDINTLLISTLTNFLAYFNPILPPFLTSFFSLLLSLSEVRTYAHYPNMPNFETSFFPSSYLSLFPSAAFSLPSPSSYFLLPPSISYFLLPLPFPTSYFPLPFPTSLSLSYFLLPPSLSYFLLPSTLFPFSLSQPPPYLRLPTFIFSLKVKNFLTR